MTNAFKSLRRSIWSGERGDVRPEDIGEALRDLYTALRSLPRLEIIVTPGVRWALPFYIRSETNPKAVILGNARVSQQPTAVDPGYLAWTWVSGQVRIDAAPALTIGTAYDLTFLVFG